jgi:hypothetical protein
MVSTAALRSSVSTKHSTPIANNNNERTKSLGYKLSNDKPKPHVPYSEREMKMFQIIPTDGKTITSVELLKQFWELFDEPPYHMRTSGMGTFRGLKKKINDNNEPFEIMATAPSGPKPLLIWITKRKA